MINWYFIMIQKPGNRDRNVNVRATVGELRKNSFEVARYGVFQNKVVSKYPRKNPHIEYIMKRGAEIENIIRYCCGSEPIAIDSKLPL